ncbi:glycoside hydrolase [Trametes elegans]|nr:glycoside hydrolase [Trametes elegans]
MFTTSLALSLLITICPAVSQQIFDVWTTTWDRDQLFKYTDLSPNPVNFVSGVPSAQADISIDDANVLQQMVGFGATLTDSSALVLSELKDRNTGNYWSILNTLFDPTDGADAAGLSYLRVPLGASDFSAGVYSFADDAGDSTLNSFDINKAPAYLFSVIKDIQSVNPYVKIHLVPWSPPGWMKDGGSMKGGSFISSYSNAYARYLLKSVQGFRDHGISAYAISIQNEPEHTDDSYPSCILTAGQEAAIGTALRGLLDANGFSSVRIVGYEHNWDDAGGYPVQLVEDAQSAFAGVAFHCYAGSVSQQDAFRNAFPGKEVHFSECTGIYGSDWWEDIKWYMGSIFIGSVARGARSALMWNLALDGNGSPKLPGTSSCGTPCRPVVQVNSDGSFAYHQEYYVMGQASKAVLPRDTNGAFGQRVGVSIDGGSAGDLVATAFVTGRTNSSDWRRYSLVVLNSDDTQGGSWRPSSIQATISFRGKKATFAFPVGVTTLTWYAS